MAKLKVQGNASGTGVVTLTAPNTNTDRTITLPDETVSLTGAPAGLDDVSGVARATSGLLFNGDTAAANALDDYEEGTWTPAVYGGGSLTLSSSPMAKYVKIGSQVTVWFYLSCDAHSGNSTAMRISGLPYANNGGSSDYMMGSSINYSAGNALLTNPHVRVQPNTSYLTFIKNQDSAIVQSELDASHIIGSATYTST